MSIPSCAARVHFAPPQRKENGLRCLPTHEEGCTALLLPCHQRAYQDRPIACLRPWDRLDRRRGPLSYIGRMPGIAIGRRNGVNGGQCAASGTPAHSPVNSGVHGARLSQGIIVAATASWAFREPRIQ